MLHLLGHWADVLQNHFARTRSCAIMVCHSAGSRKLFGVHTSLHFCSQKSCCSVNVALKSTDYNVVFVQEAQYVILVEEDLDVSPDFFRPVIHLKA